MPNDTYVRTEEGWRIKHSEYERVYELVSPISDKADATVAIIDISGLSTTPSTKRRNGTKPRMAMIN